MPIATPMRRIMALSLISLAAVAAFAGSAFARTPRPVISSVSPTSVNIGQVLTLKGKNFAKGGKNDRIYFRRASDGTWGAAERSGPRGRANLMSIGCELDVDELYRDPRA